MNLEAPIGSLTTCRTYRETRRRPGGADDEPGWRVDGRFAAGALVHGAVDPGGGDPVGDAPVREELINLPSLPGSSW